MVWWTGAWKAFRRLLAPSARRGRGREPRMRAPAESERRHGKRAGELDPQTFLSVSAGLGAHDKAARLHVFSFSDFRKAAGNKWPRLAPLVEIASLQIIRRNVDPAKDIYTRLDEETACLILPGKNRAAAHAMVTTIAKELATHLFGSQLVGLRRPQLFTANVALHEVFDDRAAVENGSGAIHQAVSQAAPLVAPETLDRDRDVVLAPVHRATLAAMLSPDEAARLPPVPAAVEPAWTELHRVQRPLAETLYLRDDTVKAEETVYRVEATRRDEATSWVDQQVHDQAREALASGRRMEADSTMTLVWTPTWVTSLNAIGAFHARVIRSDGGDATTLEGAQAYATAAPMEILTMDRFAAAQAAEELKTLFFSHQRVGLTVPVHWMSLSPRWCDFIRMPFESCPPQARRKLLKLEVFGVTPAMPQEVLAHLADPLEKLGCDVLVRLPLSAPHLAASLKGVRAIGTDLAELPEAERVGDDQLLARLRHLHAFARANDMACYVWTVRRRPMIAGIVRSGFSLVNGPGVMCDVSQPFRAGAAPSR